MCISVCENVRDLCRQAQIENVVLTTVTFSIDQYGNLDITDPLNQFTPTYSENIGNLEGTGSLINRFYTDISLNLFFNEQ